MAKKSRPTFSAPSTKGAPTPAAPGWVYRSEPAPKARTTARRTPAAVAAPAPVIIAAPVRSAASTASSPGVLVSGLAVLMYPCALVAIFVGSPLGRLWRARSAPAAVTPHGPA